MLRLHKHVYWKDVQFLFPVRQRWYFCLCFHSFLGKANIAWYNYRIRKNIVLFVGVWHDFVAYCDSQLPGLLQFLLFLTDNSSYIIQNNIQFYEYLQYCFCTLLW